MGASGWSGISFTAFKCSGAFWCDLGCGVFLFVVLPWHGLSPKVHCLSTASLGNVEGDRCGALMLLLWVSYWNELSWIMM